MSKTKNKTITLTELEIDKIITHCESMLEMCDTPEEREIYQTLIDKLSS
jgi:hypothetical protein